MDLEDIGPLPTRPPPGPGERLLLEMEGRPPIKTYGRSMRNVTSSQRSRFMALRRAAIAAMDGRRWYDGPIGLDLVYHGPTNRMLDFGAGIMDTLGGSHGPSFIYLPIVYLDDGQVAAWHWEYLPSDSERYTLTIIFLGEDEDSLSW